MSALPARRRPASRLQRWIRRCIPCCFLHAALLPAAVFAEAPDATTDRIVSSEALRADAAVLRRAYETLHPGLLRYNTPDQLAQRFADLDRALDHDQPLGEAFVAFTRFTATLRCGHSYPNFYNQPREIAALLTRGANRLPFRFVWLDRAMVVTDNFSGDPRLARGAIVDTIDGVAVSTVLERLLPLARADGGNDAKRIDLLQVQGTDRFESFDVYYPLVFPKDGSTYVLGVRGETSPVRVDGIDDAKRLATRPHAEGAADAAANPLGWTLRHPADRIALLTMPTWAAYDTTWDWKAFLRETFDALAARRTSRLVIDLRGNEGGSSVGDEIVAHLVRSDLVGRAVVRRTRYRSVPDGLRPVLDTWDRSFFDWGDAAIGPDRDGFYRLTKYDDSAAGTVIAPVAPRFDGEVVVLVDASNSSATFEFARLVQSNRLGTLVGSPTGGNLRGINGGAFFFLRLPASKIEIDVPLIGQFPAAAMPDAGVVPDVTIARTVADIAAGADPVLRYGLDR